MTLKLCLSQHNLATMLIVFQNSKYFFLSTTWRPRWTRRRCWPPTPMSWATRRRTSTGETFAFFDGTSIFKNLFTGHFSTTQTAQSVLKRQGKSFQISRHTLLRMTGASATLRLRWIYHNLFHCWSHQDNQGFAYIIDLDQRWIAIHFPKHIKTSRGWSDYGSYKSPPFNQSSWLKLQTGDELSKRSKFVFCTWIGPNVSVMKKAKMGTDKAFVKEVIQVIAFTTILLFGHWVMLCCLNFYWHCDLLCQ